MGQAAGVKRFRTKDASTRRTGTTPLQIWSSKRADAACHEPPTAVVAVRELRRQPGVLWDETVSPGTGMWWKSWHAAAF